MITKGKTVEWKASVGGKPVHRSGVIERLGDKALCEGHLIYVRRGSKLHVVNRRSIILPLPN